MSPETKQRGAFEDALDGDPDDWDLRLVYADWLEDYTGGEADTVVACPICGGTGEGLANQCVHCSGTGQGRIPGTVLAAGQRWQAEKKRCPQDRRHSTDSPGWWWHNTKTNPADRRTRVSPGLLSDMKNTSFVGGLTAHSMSLRFPTRHAAEIALAVALKRLRQSE